MPPIRRRPPQEFVNDIEVDDDGIRPVRDAHDFSRNKLGILWSYLRRYASACKSAGEFFFVDGLAGPGRYQILERNQFLLGSTPIALKVEPEFTKCLALEYDAANANALIRRTEGFRPRSVVEKGNCNTDLIPLIQRNITGKSRTKPIFVLLDPEGFELHWNTVRDVSRVRLGSKKAELLILIPSTSIPRFLPVDGDIMLWNEMTLNHFLPPDSDWRGIWRRRMEGNISPSQAIDLYLESYRVGLKDSLGYKHVIVRDIRKANGQLIYHLAFASDDDTGLKIMHYIFETMEPNRDQLRLI